MTERCPAWFEGDKPSDRTHTCDLEPGHTGLHKCPRCGSTWGVEIHQVQLYLCDLCLDGKGGECHTPGCAMWLNRAPDLPLRDKAEIIPDDDA